MRKDFQRLARELRATIADGAPWPMLGDTHETYETRRSAGMIAKQRAQYIAQHCPSAGGFEFLKACGVRPHA